MNGNLEDIAPMTDFTCARCQLATAMFRQASLEPGPFGLELNNYFLCTENYCVNFITEYLTSLEGMEPEIWL